MATTSASCSRLFAVVVLSLSLAYAEATKLALPQSTPPPDAYLSLAATYPCPNVPGYVCNNQVACCGGSTSLTCYDFSCSPVGGASVCSQSPCVCTSNDMCAGSLMVVGSVLYNSPYCMSGVCSYLSPGAVAGIVIGSVVGLVVVVVGLVRLFVNVGGGPLPPSSRPFPSPRARLR